MLKNKPGLARLLIIIFYGVGLAGFLHPATKPMFMKIIPLALLLSFGLLMYFHAVKITMRELLVFSAILVISFFIEVVGVNTGIIFGHYNYGDGLGIKLFHTPIIIGLNWLFLTYTVASIVESIQLPKGIKLIAAPGLMLMYDILMEQVAPSLDMWNWANSTIPMQNYLAWYFISLGLIALLKIFRIDTRNPLSFTLFACQLIFFAILVLII